MLDLDKDPENKLATVESTFCEQFCIERLRRYKLDVFPVMEGLEFSAFL